MNKVNHEHDLAVVDRVTLWSTEFSVHCAVGRQSRDLAPRGVGRQRSQAAEGADEGPEFA